MSLLPDSADVFSISIKPGNIQKCLLWATWHCLQRESQDVKDDTHGSLRRTIERNAETDQGAPIEHRSGGERNDAGYTLERYILGNYIRSGSVYPGKVPTFKKRISIKGIYTQEAYALERCTLSESMYLSRVSTIEKPLARPSLHFKLLSSSS